MNISAIQDRDNQSEHGFLHVSLTILIHHLCSHSAVPTGKAPPLSSATPPAPGHAGRIPFRPPLHNRQWRPHQTVSLPHPGSCSGPAGCPQAGRAQHRWREGHGRWHTACHLETSPEQSCLQLPKRARVPGKPPSPALSASGASVLWRQRSTRPKKRQEH